MPWGPRVLVSALRPKGRPDLWLTPDWGQGRDKVSPEQFLLPEIKEVLTKTDWGRAGDRGHVKRARGLLEGTVMGSQFEHQKK